MEIISRQEAIKNRLTYYYTGIECPKEHISKRSVHNGTCYICKCESRAKADGKNKEGVKERSRKYYENKPTRQEKPEKTEKYYEDRRLRRNEQSNKSAKANRSVGNARSAKRRAQKLNATPSWADFNAIREFYKYCPKGMAVDHIIPLQGKLVSGLHVDNNLQYLTSIENSSKHNTFEPEHLISY